MLEYLQRIFSDELNSFYNSSGGVRFMGCDIEEFRKTVSKIRKNNSYKFALAKFLLDYSNSKECEAIEDKKIDYKVIANAFLCYYWKQVCLYDIKQVSDNQNQPIIITIIKEYCNRDKIDKNKIVREIEKQCFKDVIPRFQYNNGTFYRHYHELQGGSYKMPSENERYIYLFKESIACFRDNYESLNGEVIEEWERFLEKFNGDLDLSFFEKI